MIFGCMSLRAACYLPAPRTSSRLLISLRHVRCKSSSIDYPPIRVSVGQDRACYHWDTPVSTLAQRKRAFQFYQHSRPAFLYSTPTFRNIRVSSLPEVAFFGRSNVGKSSLLNAVMNKDLCYTSRQPGRTCTMNFYAVGGADGQGNKGKMVLLDMPGYGDGSHSEWGREIEKYLSHRKQLKRAFLLIDASHGLKHNDKEVLGLLRKLGVPHQIILNKVDRIFRPGKIKTRKIHVNFQRSRTLLTDIVRDLRKDLQPRIGDGPEALGEVITCSTHERLRQKKWGIGDLRWATLVATGLDEEKKWPVDLTMPQPLGTDPPQRIISEKDLVISE